MIKIDAKDAAMKVRLLALSLSKTEMQRGISKAINNTALQGRTIARKNVSSIYNIPQKDLSKISIERSTAATLTAIIKASAKPLPLTSFSPKYDLPTKSIRTTKRGALKVTERKSKRKRRNQGKGVSIEIYSGKRQVIPFAFMTQRITAVFARGKYISTGFDKRNKRAAKEGNDLPIQALVSVTVHTAVINDQSLSAIGNKVKTMLPNEIEREIKYRLRKIKR